jgi:hypothetical protein
MPPRRRRHSARVEAAALTRRDGDQTPDPCDDVACDSGLILAISPVKRVIGTGVHMEPVTRARVHARRCAAWVEAIDAGRGYGRLVPTHDPIVPARNEERRNIERGRRSIDVERLELLKIRCRTTVLTGRRVIPDRPKLVVRGERRPGFVDR